MNIKQSEELKIKRGLHNKRSKETINKFIISKSKSIICINGKNEQYFNSIKEAQDILKIDHSTIIKVLKGKKEHYKGLKFIYI